MESLWEVSGREEEAESFAAFFIKGNDRMEFESLDDGLLGFVDMKKIVMARQSSSHS